MNKKKFFLILLFFIAPTLCMKSNKKLFITIFNDKNSEPLFPIYDPPSENWLFEYHLIQGNKQTIHNTEYKKTTSTVDEKHQSNNLENYINYVLRKIQIKILDKTDIQKQITTRAKIILEKNHNKKKKQNKITKKKESNICQFCNQKYPQIKEHEQYRCKKNPKRTYYYCQYCNKKTNHPYDLKRHESRCKSNFDKINTIIQENKFQDLSRQIANINSIAQKTQPTLRSVRDLKVPPSNCRYCQKQFIYNGHKIIHEQKCKLQQPI